MKRLTCSPSSATTGALLRGGAAAAGARPPRLDTPLARTRCTASTRRSASAARVPVIALRRRPRRRGRRLRDAVVDERDGLPHQRGRTAVSHCAARRTSPSPSRHACCSPRSCIFFGLFALCGFPRPLPPGLRGWRRSAPPPSTRSGSRAAASTRRAPRSVTDELDALGAAQVPECRRRSANEAVGSPRRGRRSASLARCCDVLEPDAVAAEAEALPAERVLAGRRLDAGAARGTVPRGRLCSRANVADRPRRRRPGPSPAIPVKLTPRAARAWAGRRSTSNCAAVPRPARRRRQPRGAEHVAAACRRRCSLRVRDSRTAATSSVISEGFGLMPSYASDAPREERWAVVAYVRALQLSQRRGSSSSPPERAGSSAWHRGAAMNAKRFEGRP